MVIKIVACVIGKMQLIKNVKMYSHIVYINRKLVFGDLSYATTHVTCN
jgi:hypothetical protein